MEGVFAVSDVTAGHVQEGQAISPNTTKLKRPPWSCKGLKSPAC